jgi:hypothetical protein
VVAHYRPPEPTTGTHFAILFHASASEENLSSEASFCLGRTSVVVGPLLVNHELVRSSEEDLRWQVPANFTTEGALNGDGLERKLHDAGWNVAAALLAGHHEGLAISGCREHASMIGNTLRESSEHQHTCLSG